MSNARDDSSQAGKRDSKDLFRYGVPPQNREAEESILSAILIDNATLLDVLEILSPEDFYRSAHQKIFEAISDLFSRNEPVDLVTLSNMLKSKGHLEMVGGAAYLASIIDTVPLAANAQHYAKIVHDKANLRRLIDKSNQIAKRCFEDRGEVEEVIDFAESAIFEISGAKSRQSFYKISDIINDNIEAA